MIRAQGSTGHPWLEPMAASAFDRHNLVGIAAVVVGPAGLEGVAFRGNASVEHNRPVDERTIFRIGSLSKLFTACLIMQLVDDGAVDLDAPIAEYVRFGDGRSRNRADAVSVHQLLSHTSGLGEVRSCSDLFRPGLGLELKPQEPPPELTRYYRRFPRVDGVPGSRWAYANHGYGILGLVAETICAVPFTDAVRLRLLEPLGLRHTTIGRAPSVSADLATAYSAGRRGHRVVKGRDTALLPSGGGFSTIEDLGRFVGALASGGPPLVSPRALDAMLTHQFPPERDDRSRASEARMGLGFFLGTVASQPVAGHEGSWSGFVSSMLMAPGTGVGAVVMTNSETALGPSRLCEDIIRKRLGLADRCPPPVTEHSQEAQELSGLYRLERGLNLNARWWSAFGGEATVSLVDGALVVRAPSKVKALRRGVRLAVADADDSDRFWVPKSPIDIRLTFERDAAGRAVALCAVSRLFGFVRLRRRTFLASLRIWSRAACAVLLGGAGAIVARHLRSRRNSS